MDATPYKIRKALTIPLGLNWLLAIALLMVCSIQNQPTAKLVILSLVSLVLGIVFFESLFRRILIDDNSIKHFKFLRKKDLTFSEITSFDAMRLRKRIFATISTETSFLIFTNGYENFPGLALKILKKVPENTVNKETRELLTSSQTKCGDIISLWVATVVLGGILLLQVSIYFK